MTNIPVTGLYAALSLDPTNLEGGIAKAQRGLAGLQNAFNTAKRGAAAAGDQIDKGLSKGLSSATVSSKTLGAEFDRLKGRMDPLAAAIGGVDKAAEKLDRQLKRGVITAEQHATAMASLKDKGLAAVAVEADRLKMKFDPLYASSKRYENAVQELDRALAVGALTQQRYDAAMEQLNAQLATGATSFGVATTQAQRFNATADNMSSYTGNIAAQFQDIGVQLAGGQSPFLIALQQGTQLNGVFTQMGGGVSGVAKGLGSALLSLVSPLSLITVGAIAAGGALIQGFLNAGEKAKTLKERIDGLSAATSEMRDISSLTLDDIIEKYGRLDDRITRMIERQKRAAISQAMIEARSVVSDLGDEYGALLENFAAIENQAKGFSAQIAAGGLEAEAARAEIEALWRDFDLAAQSAGLTAEQVRQLRDAMQEVNTAEGFEAQAASLDRMLTILDALGMSGTAWYGEVVAAQEALEEARSTADNLQAGFDDVRDAATAAATAAGSIGDAASGALGGVRALADAMWDAAQARISANASLDAMKMEFSPAGRALAKYGSRGTTSDRPVTMGNGKVVSAPVRGSSGGGSVDQTARDVERLNEAVANGITPLDRFRAGLAKLDALKGKGLSDAAYSQELARLNDELASSIPMVDDVADAFANFVVNGFKDFQGFVKSIGNSFKKMLADMIATAARNRIMIGLGIGGGVGGIGGAASAATGLMGGGGGLLGLGSLGGAASGLWSGLSGVLSGGGLGSSFANLGGLLSGSVGGLGAIGAAIPALGAIGLVAGLFSKKTKLLDEGLTLNANEWGGLANSFNTKQTSRFFGLSKKTSTTIGPNVPEVSGAIGTMQAEIASMAKSLGVGAEAFKGFGYTVNLSLKGLTEEQRAAKVAEEIAKMGDAFAAMIPGVKSVNDLLAITQQRYDLETQLLTLQGNEAELRRRALETINPHNRALQRQIWAMEDAQEATNKLNEALGQLSENDYATALDFNRARGALASGLRVVGGTDTVAPIVASVGTGSTASPMDARMEAILANINSNIALLWKQVQRWDIDGLPAVRA